MSGSGIAFADYAVVVSFFIVMISVGVFFGRKQRSVTQQFGWQLLQFINAGIPWFRGVSVILTSTCVATFTGLLVGTLLFPDDAEHRADLELFFEKVGKPSPVLEGSPARITFFPLVAGGLAFIAVVLIVASVATRPLAEVRLSVAGGGAMLAVAALFLWISRRSNAE